MEPIADANINAVSPNCDFSEGFTPSIDNINLRISVFLLIAASITGVRESVLVWLLISDLWSNKN